MAGFSTAEVRAFLAEIEAGRPALSARPELFPDLRAKGAVVGQPGAPQITPVGHHVLRELSLRAYRADALSLDVVSNEMNSVLSEIDRAARAAEYFLGDIGPLAPIETLPYMRITSAALVSGGASPEEVAEQFRNIWGMIEVLGGRGSDRLLAAEMLVGTSVPISRLYAPISHTVEQLRTKGGQSAHPVASACLLHLHPAPTPEPPLEAWSGWRVRVGSDLIAAALAGTSASASSFGELRGQFEREGAAPPEAEQAAAYLLAVADHPTVFPRAIAVARLLQGQLPTPFIAGALLAARHPLAAEELVDWVEKAAPLAENRRLAPSPAERKAIAVALVHGLDPNAFHWSGAAPSTGASPALTGNGAIVLLALHAWIYRTFVEPAVPAGRPAAAGTA